VGLKYTYSTMPECFKQTELLYRAIKTSRSIIVVNTAVTIGKGCNNYSGSYFQKE